MEMSAAEKAPHRKPPSADCCEKEVSDAEEIAGT